MTNQPDFDIKSKGQVSKEFIDRNIVTFKQASIFIRQLAYGRNADKNNLVSILKYKRPINHLLIFYGFIFGSILSLFSKMMLSSGYSINILF